MNEFVICEICSQKLKRITNTHLKQHNLTFKEYIELYPNSNTTSKIVRDKISKNGKGITGRKAGFKHNKKHKKLISNLMKNRKITWKDKIRETIQDYYDNNTLIGWKSKECYENKPEYMKNIFYGNEWLSIRSKVKQRDKFICQDCKKKENKLAVHHIIPFKHYLLKHNGSLEKARKDAHKLKNLITLCFSCHMKRERRIQKSI